jgi:hypothetical protein
MQSEWKPDGSSLFYLAPGGKLMEVSVKEKGPAVEIGIPHQFFQMTAISGEPFRRAYTVAPNGQRFLVNALQRGGAPEPLTLVTNWTAGLK